MSSFEFIPNTSEDQRKMLAEIGLNDIEQLFADIPPEVLRKFKPMGLDPFSEPEVKQLLTALAQADPYVSFLGGGIYDHYIPSIIPHLIGRGEFLTCYTPYQAELSQGTLTWMFEFQTMICELTGDGGRQLINVRRGLGPGGSDAHGQERHGEDEIPRGSKPQPALQSVS
jgi:glycine dehydrogenase subunit 1